MQLNLAHSKIALSLAHTDIKLAEIVHIWALYEVYFLWIIHYLSKDMNPKIPLSLFNNTNLTREYS